MKQNTPRSNNRKPTGKSPATRTFITARQKQYLFVIFGLSFVVSLILELYTFGFPDGFFVRWFSTLMVFFLLIAITVLAIIPLVNYVVNRWLRF